MKKTPLEVDKALLDSNLIGTISLTKAVLPHMIARHYGQIVIVSSVLGKFGNADIFYRNFTSSYFHYELKRKINRFYQIHMGSDYF